MRVTKQSVQSNMKYVQVNSMLHFVHQRICIRILSCGRSSTSVQPWSIL